MLTKIQIYAILYLIQPLYAAILNKAARIYEKLKLSTGGTAYETQKDYKRRKKTFPVRFFVYRSNYDGNLQKLKN